MPISTTTATRVNAIVADRQVRGHVPAIVAGIIRDGALIHTAAAGEVDPAQDMSTVQSRIGSISKTFTAALILGLHREGRLDLDAPVAAYLPGLATTSPTPRQLLAHVGGLQREPVGPWWERNRGTDIPTMLAAVGADAQVHAPLSTYHYSNLGYGLLGAVVSAVTGDTFADAFTTRIAKPLGLNRTTYDPVEPYLTGYVVHPYADVRREEPREDSGAMAAAGQLWSTVADLGQWAAYLTGCVPDAPDILAPADIDEFFRPTVIDDMESWATGHSLGLQMWRAGDRVYAGHTGSMPGYLSVVMMHRSTRTAVVAFVNAYSLRDLSLVGLGKDLLTVAIEREPIAPARRRATAGPPADIASLLGTWWWMGDRFDLEWDASGELVMSRGEQWRFRRTGPDAWRCRTGMNDGETMYVRRDAAGTPIELDIATFIFLRDPWPDQIR